MEITKTTIKVQCSLNYQVASIEAEIENYTEMELDAYIGHLVKKCSEIVKNVSNAVGETHTQNVQQKPVVQTQVQRPTQNNYNAPRTTTYQNQGGFNAQQNNVRPASQKQLDYLRNAFNYVPQGSLTFDEANNLLMQFKNQH